MIILSNGNDRFVKYCRRKLCTCFVNYLLGVSQALQDKTRQVKHLDERIDRRMEHMKEERRTDGHPRKKKEGRTDHQKEGNIRNRRTDKGKGTRIVSQELTCV